MIRRLASRNLHQGAEGGREKRKREGSSRQAKNKKPEEDPEEGGPSALSRADWEWDRGCLC